MQTSHRVLNTDSRNLPNISDQSIDLIITSPPYPLIQMWDELFSPVAKSFLDEDNGNTAFEAMHRELDRVWRELYRVMKEGAIACINIGDATRTFGGRFQIYPNHCRVRMAFWGIGFDTLPTILWRKPTNAPNKFMGSGMLPVGAYVTLEHEHILIFRKGAKRSFNSAGEKNRRLQSSFFWEERNKWFSDVWDIKGTKQKLDDKRRSGAFPFELPYRLINMYSLYGDTVLDPFMGTGTTMLAAIASGRNSIGVELDETFLSIISERSLHFKPEANKVVAQRIQAHTEYLKLFYKKPVKYVNETYNFPVMTNPETKIKFFSVSKIESTPPDITVSYEPV